MNNVVSIDDLRLKREKREHRDPGPHYYCTKCEGVEFRIFSSGVIHCATVGCGALMRNIGVVETK